MMNIPVVLATASESFDWGVALSTAGTVTLMGMVTIFTVLAALWAAIEVMHRVLHKDQKKAKEAPAPASAPAPAAAPAPVSSEDDGAIVAAITAAIMAMRSESGESSAFRVVSFKRANRK